MDIATTAKAVRIAGIALIVMAILYLAMTVMVYWTAKDSSRPTGPIWVGMLGLAFSLWAGGYWVIRPKESARDFLRLIGALPPKTPQSGISPLPMSAAPDESKKSH